jgi:hypothetical protein
MKIKLKQKRVSQVRETLFLLKIKDNITGKNTQISF